MIAIIDDSSASFAFAVSRFKQFSFYIASRLRLRVVGFSFGLDHTEVLAIGDVINNWFFTIDKKNAALGIWLT